MGKTDQYLEFITYAGNQIITARSILAWSFPMLYYDDELLLEKDKEFIKFKLL